jgi:hypothetical protein
MDKKNPSVGHSKNRCVRSRFNPFPFQIKGNHRDRALDPVQTDMVLELLALPKMRSPAVSTSRRIGIFV